MRFLLVILLTVMLAGGCTTKSSLAPGAGGSTFEIRGKSYNEIWKASIKVATRSLTITESNKESGIIKAEKSAGMTTWGEVVGIYIKPITSESKFYIIEVQSLKRSALQLTGQDWTMTIIAGIKAELDQ